MLTLTERVHDDMEQVIHDLNQSPAWRNPNFCKAKFTASASDIIHTAAKAKTQADWTEIQKAIDDLARIATAIADKSPTE